MPSILYAQYTLVIHRLSVHAFDEKKLLREWRGRRIRSEEIKKKKEKKKKYD